MFQLIFVWRLEQHHVRQVLQSSQEGYETGLVWHPFGTYYILLTMSACSFGPTGEIHEMQKELESQKPEKQKNALKGVIGAMTIGKDVSMLFPHVVKCINTNDLELKKLVYLYVMNYAKSQPDLVILSVNTFVTVSDHLSTILYFFCPLEIILTDRISGIVQDATKHTNPLVRALAIRTMGCIRLQKIAEYLYHPLRTALKVLPSHTSLGSTSLNVSLTTCDLVG